MPRYTLVLSWGEEGEEGREGEEGEEGEEVASTPTTPSEINSHSAAGKGTLVPQRREVQLNSLGQVIDFNGGTARSKNTRSQHLQAVAAAVNSGKLGRGFCELAHIKLFGDERPGNVLDLHSGGGNVKRRLKTLGLTEHVGYGTD